jgi:hypothetical protein
MSRIDSDKAASSYAVAFKVGVIGTALLVLATAAGDTLLGLIALAIWSQVTLFVLPMLYVFYRDKLVDLPYDLIRVVR